MTHFPSTKALPVLRFLAALAGLWLLLQTGASAQTAQTTAHEHRFVPLVQRGGEKPQLGDLIRVHVYVSLGNQRITSTRETDGEPRTMALPEPDAMPAQPPAIIDAALLMGEGDSAAIFQTLDVSQIEGLPDSLRNVKEVRYDVVLLEVITKAEAAERQAKLDARFIQVRDQMPALLASYTAGTLADSLYVLPSGLKLYVERLGDGAPVASGEPIVCHYYGCLVSGKMFDNSFLRGEPLRFTPGVGQMIPGFDEGVLRLRHGGRAVFFIPPDLGYGPEGTPDGVVPPKAEIVFYVEIL